MPGRLNMFQRTMLQWNDLHAYNAVHVVRIPAALDLERLAGAVNGTLEIHGLTGLSLDRHHYQYHGGPVRCEIRTVAAEENGCAVPPAEIERQINTPFVQGENFNPFRFFAVPGPDSFSLGLVYFHAIADAGAIVLLLRDMVLAYLSPGQRQPPQPFNLYPRCSDGSFLRPGLLARRIAAVPAKIRTMRSTSRPDCRSETDSANGFTLFTLAPASLASLAATAKAWEVKLNDLFLALLMKSLSPLKPERLRRPKRRNLTLGCVANLRQEIAPADGRPFGLFLGSWLVSHELPEGTGLMELAKDIRQRTAAIKRDKLYLAPPLDMVLACHALPWFSAARRLKIYRKNYPLWGGITNLNLNAVWECPPGAQPPDYFRAVSTGPVTPLVLSLTTVGNGVNLAITYRTSFFSGPAIEQVKTAFREMVKQLNP